MLGADDSLDVFGVHGVGGIVGALLTGVFNTPGARRPGPGDRLGHGDGRLQRASARRSGSSCKAVLLTIVWSGVVVVHRLQDRRPGDRPARDGRRGARRPGHHVARRDGLPATRRSATALQRRDGAACRGGPFSRYGGRLAAAFRRQRTDCTNAAPPPACARIAPRQPGRPRMVPHLITALTGPINELEQRILESHAGHRALVPARVDGAHAAVLHARSTCATPASSWRRSTPTCSPAASTTSRRRCCRWRCRRRWRRSRRSAPRRENLLLIPENHTRNTFYLTNVRG